MLKHSETTIFANVYSKSYYVLTVMKASEVYNLVARCHRSKVAIASSHGPCFVLFQGCMIIKIDGQIRRTNANTST